MDMQHRCGKDSNGFYDRKGDYFRKGVDPRNYFGRFVERPTYQWRRSHHSLIQCGKFAVPKVN